MIKIIFIGSEERNYAVIKGVLSELSFLYEGTLELKKYFKMCLQLKEEILDADCKKIYIIEVNSNNYSKSFNLLKYLRQNDWNSEIILIKDGLVTFEKTWDGICKVFDVIESNLVKDRIRKDLNLICTHTDSKKTFNFKNRDMNLSIYLEKILYIYRDTDSRKVVVVTDNNLYTINMGLKDVFFLLDKRFKQVHRACLANTMRVEKYDWSNNTFTLDNGKEINLLSKHYKDTLEDTMKF